MPKRARKRSKNTQMPPAEIARLLKSLDRRVTRIEQILPTLATKDDLKTFPTADDLKGFATKDDLKGFATKDDLKGFATKDDLKGFATKDDLKGFATKDDLREEGERSRRHMTVLYEHLVSRLDQHLDAYGHHKERLADHGTRLDGHDAGLASLDVRVMALEKPRSSD